MSSPRNSSSGTAAPHRSSSPLRLRPDAVARWIAAAVLAVAIAWLISIVFGSGPDVLDVALVAGTLAIAAGHLALHPDGRERRLLLLVPTAALTWAALFGDFFLILVEGGCGDGGDIGLVSWIGAGVVYVAGSAWALQRPVRGLIGVPASMLAAGVWLVLTADAISGGTGACLD